MNIEKLIALSRATMTPEQKKQREKEFKERMRQMDLEMIERHRCRTCGADTLNYSHSFTCPWRGTSF